LLFCLYKVFKPILSLFLENRIYFEIYIWKLNLATTVTKHKVIKGNNTQKLIVIVAIICDALELYATTEKDCQNLCNYKHHRNKFIQSSSWVLGDFLKNKFNGIKFIVKVKKHINQNHRNNNCRDKNHLASQHKWLSCNTAKNCLNLGACWYKLK